MCTRRRVLLKAEKQPGYAVDSAKNKIAFYVRQQTYSYTYTPIPITNVELLQQHLF